jgi:hypothetical protein
MLIPFHEKKRINAYILVLDKQNEMLKSSGKKINIHDIVSNAVIFGIEFVGKK